MTSTFPLGGSFFRSVAAVVIISSRIGCGNPWNVAYRARMTEVLKAAQKKTAYRMLT